MVYCPIGDSKPFLYGITDNSISYIPSIVFTNGSTADLSTFSLS